MRKWESSSVAKEFWFTKPMYLCFNGILPDKYGTGIFARIFLAPMFVPHNSNYNKKREDRQRGRPKSYKKSESSIAAEQRDLVEKYKKTSISAIVSCDTRQRMREASSAYHSHFSGQDLSYAEKTDSYQNGKRYLSIFLYAGALDDESYTCAGVHADIVDYYTHALEYIFGDDNAELRKRCEGMLNELQRNQPTLVVPANYNSNCFTQAAWLLCANLILKACGDNLDGEKYALVSELLGIAVETNTTFALSSHKTLKLDMALFRRLCINLIKSDAICAWKNPDVAETLICCMETVEQQGAFDASMFAIARDMITAMGMGLSEVSKKFATEDHDKVDKEIDELREGMNRLRDLMKQGHYPKTPVP